MHRPSLRLLPLWVLVTAGCDPNRRTIISTACDRASSLVSQAGRSCSTSSDCFVAAHEAGCCEDIEIVGLAASERSRFEEAERECRASRQELCGCPFSARFDDGSMILAQADVVCRAGTCTSFVSGCGGPCPAGRVCHRCVNSQKGFYYACSVACRSSADCTDPALPACVAGSGTMFCAAAAASCAP